MGCYDQMKNSFISAVSESCPEMTVAQLEKIVHALDCASSAYEITKSETALTVVNGDVPGIVRDYIAVKKVEGLSAGTLKVKFYILRSFCSRLRKPLTEVNANDIRIYLYRYQEEKHVSNASLDGQRVVICSFFRWAASEGYIDRDPGITVKPIKCEKKQRLSLTQLELEYLRRGCQTLRERAILEFLYSTGSRVSELCGVKLSDIDFISGEVKLFGKGQKHRVSYLNAKASVALKEYLDSRGCDCEYAFCTDRAPHLKLTAHTVEIIIKQIASRAPEIRKPITPHILRHTMATQAVANGMDITNVQKLLGHVNLSTTMIYVERDEEQIRASHRKAVI